MKKNIFMILAMFAIAFTAISFTSCKEETEEKILVGGGYSGKATVSIYDEKNQLSDMQRSLLQTVVSSIQDFNIGYVREEAELEREFNVWASNVDKKIQAYVEKNPETAETAAGILITISKGDKVERKIALLSNYLKKN